MMAGGLGHAARRIALRSAFGVAGALCLIVGIVFLTVAAWMAISLAAGAVTAALIIGGTYTGVGLILFAVARLVRSRPVVPPAPVVAPQTQLISGIVAAFVEGVVAGIAARKR